KSALSVYEVDSAKLAELQPTTIITQTQCDVCAVNLSDVEAALQEIVGTNPQIVSLEPNSLDDIWDDFRRVGYALGAHGLADALVADCQQRLTVLRTQVSRLRRLTKPTVACIEWMDPLMAAGNWIPELVDIAGGENLFGEARRYSSPMAFQQLQEADPEFIITMPCGFEIERTQQEMSVLTEYEGWDQLRAVREGHVFVADGNQYFNRPGPRVVESAEILVEILHQIAFGYEGVGWQRL
ncbi:MAG: ABC transporter substrate-binding protein, partial [Verrucomicrobiota bacterium]